MHQHVQEQSLAHMKNNNLEPHELALLFPPLDQNSAAQLAADIKINGQRDTITLFEGKILDGVQRYGACLDAEVEPDTSLFEFSDAFIKGMHPVDFVMSKNFHRRHLPAGQKAVIKVAAEKLREKKYSTFKENVDRGNKAYHEEGKRAADIISSQNIKRPHRRTERKPTGRPEVIDTKTRQQMAEEIKVSPGVISKAAVLARRSRSKFEAVRTGKLTLDDAYGSLPPTKQQRENAKARAEKLRCGMTLDDTLRKLREKARRNGGQIYVELGGYGFRCFTQCKGKW